MKNTMSGRKLEVAAQMPFVEKRFAFLNGKTFEDNKHIVSKCVVIDIDFKNNYNKTGYGKTEFAIYGKKKGKGNKLSPPHE